MTQLNQQFDPSQHEAMMDFSALPAGEYIAHIAKSEMKPTKDNQGQYLELVFSIDSPGFQGRKVWTRLNLINKKPSAVEMAERELKSICDAVGAGTISNSDVLHGKPMIVKLRVDPANAKYPESNSIVAYTPAGSGAGVQQTVPGMETVEQPAAQVAAADKPSWAG